MSRVTKGLEASIPFQAAVVIGHACNASNSENADPVVDRGANGRKAARGDEAARLYPKAPAAAIGGSRSAGAIGAGLARRPTKWQIANTRSARFMV